VRLPRSPFARPRVVRQLFDYRRRDFHPTDRDTDDLIRRWREELFGRDGDLTELVAS